MELRTSVSTDTDLYQDLQLELAQMARFPEKEKDAKEIKMRPYDMLAIVFAFPAFFAGAIGVGVPLLSWLGPLGVPLYVFGVVALIAGYGTLTLVMNFFNKLDMEQHRKTHYRHTPYYYMALPPTI